jgi:hypothetical protein
VLLGVGCKGMQLRTQQLMIELADVLDRYAKDLLTTPKRRAAVADNCLPIGNGTCLIQPYPAHEAERLRYTRDHALSSSNLGTSNALNRRSLYGQAAELELKGCAAQTRSLSRCSSSPERQLNDEYENDH